MQELSSERGLRGEKQRLRKPEELLWIPVTLLQHKYPVWNGTAPITPARHDSGKEEELPLRASALSPRQD